MGATVQIWKYNDYFDVLFLSFFFDSENEWPLQVSIAIEKLGVTLNVICFYFTPM